MVPDTIQLLYDGSCPKCSSIKTLINTADVGNRIEMIPLETKRGHELVEKWHDGDYVHAPHFRYGDDLYYGVEPCAKGILTTLPLIIADGLFNPDERRNRQR